MHTPKTFTYQTECCWTSGRSGAMSSGDKPSLAISSPPEFKGDGSKWNPEELLVAAVESCTMATFLAYAERRGLPINAYFSTAEGRMEMIGGTYRFTRITVRPTVMLGPGASAEEAFEVLKMAKPQCFVSNSLNAEVWFEPTVETVDLPAEKILESVLV